MKHDAHDQEEELTALRARVAELEASLALAAPEIQLNTIFDDMFEGIQVLDADLRYIYLNETAAAHGRRDRNELIGLKMSEAYPGIENTEIYRQLKQCLVENVPQQMINNFTYSDGTTGWFDLRITPVPMGVLVFSVDVSELTNTLEQLRRSNDDLGTTLECMADAVIVTSNDGRITRMNAAATVLTGWTERDSLGKPVDDLIGFVDRADRSIVDRIVDRVMKEGLKIGMAQHTLLVKREGSHVPVASSGAPIRTASGSVRGAVLVIKNMKDEYELTTMLQRAQKMDALGRLAGGVAHDFNNLLTVITCYTDILLDRTPREDPDHESIEQIKKAGERAGTLTRQLLALSRQQVLEPRLIDINSVVIDTEKMLSRLIGEDITLTTVLDTGLGSVRADPGQIEQVIMNLAVNARDAMPKGGQLTIQTAIVDFDDEYIRTHADVDGGRYVLLAITDNGVGMDSATQSRIFEPFFTTKGPGRGTGLGLATVFGIVKQSGGHIWVYSELGHGTTFKIYLPRIEQPIETGKSYHVATAPSGSETILVVEDEDAVRTVAVMGLRQFGYTVLEADNGRDAILLCANHEGPIHLLISDVIMPDMGGRIVAESIVALRPNVKVLYFSGYTDDAVVRHGILHESMAFLQKPFTPSSLARKVREVLDE